MKFAALFPGQGSQAVGMGNDFYEQSDIGKEIFAQADKALGFPLSELCFEGPLERLTLTEHAQPAILTVSYIAFALSKCTPVAAAGHSLGEYTALLAAGAISFTDAVQLVHKRGRYMQEAVAPGAGKMIAIMGPSEEEIENIINDTPAGVKEIANINSPGQIVAAGDVEGINALAENLKKQGAKVIELQVSAPFHCSLMKPAAERLAKDLDATALKDPQFPIYCNVSASKISTAAEAKTRLKEQVCGSVRWTESMHNMVNEMGIDTVIEFGQGGVLSKLMKRINPAITRLEVGTVADVAKIPG